jgi:hypothetical protein
MPPRAAPLTSTLGVLDHRYVDHSQMPEVQCSAQGRVLQSYRTYVRGMQSRVEIERPDPDGNNYGGFAAHSFLALLAHSRVNPNGSWVATARTNCCFRVRHSIRFASSNHSTLMLHQPSSFLGKHPSSQRHRALCNGGGSSGTLLRIMHIADARCIEAGRPTRRSTSLLSVAGRCAIKPRSAG